MGACLNLSVTAKPDAGQEKMDRCKHLETIHFFSLNLQILSVYDEKSFIYKEVSQVNKKM